MTPRISVVVLTRNEETHIGPCLASLAAQEDKDFEVVVVDAASTDQTCQIVEDATRTFPVPLRLHRASRRLPIGEARNLGVQLAAAPLVAFLSADAELEAAWTREAVRSLRTADVVFGRQVHGPKEWTVGAAVRGLRYHFPDGPTDEPLRYASNVAAAFLKPVLHALPFEPRIMAGEDVLLAHRAAASGFRVAYNPNLVVVHHDVANARVELTKNIREGRGMGEAAREIGTHDALLAWGLALSLAIVAATIHAPIGLTALGVILWAPALRRVARRWRHVPPRALLMGFAASPAFDLVYLTNYVAGLLTRPRAPQAGRPVEAEAAQKGGPHEKAETPAAAESRRDAAANGRAEPPRTRRAPVLAASLQEYHETLHASLQPSVFFPPFFDAPVPAPSPPAPEPLIPPPPTPADDPPSPPLEAVLVGPSQDGARPIRIPDLEEAPEPAPTPPTPERPVPEANA